MAVQSVNLKIEGGRKLSGEIITNSAKNSAVALLATSLLNRGQTTLLNLPQVEDVNRLIELLRSLGVKLTWRGKDLIIRPPAVFPLHQIDRTAVAATRSSLLFLGVLASQQLNFHFPRPGGCQLGDRTVIPHFLALQTLGIKVNEEVNGYQVSTRRVLGRREVIMHEMSDTATINTLLVAASRPDQTTIKFAASNYMVQDVCYFLQKLGIKIAGTGTSTLVVTGKSKIEQNTEYPVGEDPIEAMFFIALAATTKSPLTIRRAPIDFLELELVKLEEMGFKYKITKRYLGLNGKLNLVDLSLEKSKLTAPPDKIHPLPYPGINIDNLPFFVPIATQAKGRTLIHDWVYENRAIYYLELQKLGAKIILADPHRVYIEGPTKLHGTKMVCPPALRPAAIILIAMLAARGTSVLRNVYSINRGYEDLVGRLKKLGAKIELVK